jgi:hypothetical protein
VARAQIDRKRLIKKILPVTSYLNRELKVFVS